MANMDDERWLFVSGKVGHVEWLPHTHMFVAATWDSLPNKVTLWSDTQTSPDPVCIGSCGSPVGSVSGMSPLDSASVVLGGAGGGLGLVAVDDGASGVASSVLGTAPHTSVAAVAAAPDGGRSISVGEEGTRAVVDWTTGTVVSTGGGGALAAPLADVAWVSPHEVVTVGTQVERWDLRADPASGPVLVMKDVSASATLNTVALHPNQPEIMATGGSDGVLSVWDVRSAGWAVSNVHAHERDIWDLQFHSLHPDFLFSASDDGTILRWNFNATNDRSRVSFAFRDDSNMAIDQVLDSMLPVNAVSITVTSDTLVAGADNGLVVLRNILPEF